MRDYYKLFLAGQIAQLEKLTKNEHKRGFDEVTVQYAFARLAGEMSELTEEITQLFLYNGDYSAIRAEAADVANFAHMLILACDKEMKVED